MSELARQGSMNRGAAAEDNVIGDVASGATLNMDHMHEVVCKLNTTDTGNETRVLPPPHGAGIGARLLVCFKARSGGGTPTITLTQLDEDGAGIDFDQAGNGNVQLDAPNSWALFERLFDDDVPAWRLIASDDTTLS